MKYKQKQGELPLAEKSNFNNGTDTLLVVKNSQTIIWEKLKNGDKSALGELYDLFIDDLFSYGMSQSHDKGHVMDCMHDLFFDLYKYRKNLSLTNNVKFYLFKSLKRKINRKYNRKIVPIQRDFQISIDENKKNYTKSHETNLISLEITEEKNAKLSEALNKLTKKQKNGLFLRFNKEKSYKEIAEIMEISIQSSRTTVYRAIKALRKDMYHQ